jgi:hypothetical protein
LLEKNTKIFSLTQDGIFKNFLSFTKSHTVNSRWSPNSNLKKKEKRNTVWSLKRAKAITGQN